MIRTHLYLDLFIIFATVIIIPHTSSAEYLDEIKDDPVQGLFSEAVLQSHLNERVCNCNVFYLDMCDYISEIFDEMYSLNYIFCR